MVSTMVKIIGLPQSIIKRDTNEANANTEKNLKPF